MDPTKQIVYKGHKYKPSTAIHYTKNAAVIGARNLARSSNKNTIVKKVEVYVVYRKV